MKLFLKNNLPFFSNIGLLIALFTYPTTNLTGIKEKISETKITILKKNEDYNISKNIKDTNKLNNKYVLSKNAYPMLIKN